MHLISKAFNLSGRLTIPKIKVYAHPILMSRIASSAVSQLFASIVRYILDNSTWRLKYMSTADPFTVAHVKFSIVFLSFTNKCRISDTFILDALFPASNTVNLGSYSGVIDAGEFSFWSLQNEERRQVSGVRCDDDHSESSPHHSQHTRGKTPWSACEIY